VSGLEGNQEQNKKYERSKKKHPDPAQMLQGKVECVERK
jgi:hypothetical protein